MRRKWDNEMNWWSIVNKDSNRIDHDLYHDPYDEYLA